jgi:purine-cytosine permease-like protein
VALVVGNLILFTIFSFTSYMGAKTGLTTYMLAERAFGRYGARILINFVASGIPAFAWYGFETWLAAAAIGVIAGWDIGGPDHLMDWRTAAFTMITGIIMAIPPMMGLTSVALIDFVSIPIMVALTGYGLYLGYKLGAAGALLSYNPGVSPEMMAKNMMLAIHIVNNSWRDDSLRYCEVDKTREKKCPTSRVPRLLLCGSLYGDSRELLRSCSR